MISFKTINGNCYAWDEKTSMFIPFNEIMKKIFEIYENREMSKNDVIELLGTEYTSEEISFCFDWVTKWRKIYLKNEHQIETNNSAWDIRLDILKNGLTSLTLGITEDCNLRCKYCSFSDHYKYSRSHANNYMNFLTAKKAIDHYFSLFKEGIKFNPIRPPSIGFYGGEPLLNFSLIKKCFRYISEEYNFYKDLIITLTTNGTLLDNKKADWLMDNNFLIYVSLDGDRIEHNRNRVYENGNATFDKIIKNVRYIVDQGYKKISLIPVYDLKTNILINDEFFRKSNLPNLISVSSVNNLNGSNYYDQFIDEDLKSFDNKIKTAKNKYFTNYSKKEREDSYFYYLFVENIESEIFGNYCMSSTSPIIPHTGTCIPGKKIFVDVNGDFYVCERVNKNFSIGNIEDGLDFDKIRYLIDTYMSNMDKCGECNLKYRCKQCFQTFEHNEGFICSSKLCKDEEDYYKNEFIEAFSAAENYPQIIDENYENINIKKFCNGD